MTDLKQYCENAYRSLIRHFEKFTLLQSFQLEKVLDESNKYIRFLQSLPSFPQNLPHSDYRYYCSIAYYINMSLKERIIKLLNHNKNIYDNNDPRNKYLLCDSLKEKGSYLVLRRALCIYDNIFYISKMFLIDNSTQEKIAPYENENNLLNILSSDNDGCKHVIRKIEDKIDSDNWKWVILEDAGNYNLYHLISALQCNLSENKWKDYFRQILTGLEFIQNHCIAHLDMSLDNVMVSYDLQTLKIIDFDLGISYTDNKPLDNKHLFGKIYFFPPELYFGESKYPQYDPPQCDIFSAGIMFAAMLYKKFPYLDFGSVSCHRFYENIVKDAKNTIIEIYNNPKVEISSQAIEFLSKMLCAPNERFTAKALLRHSYLSM